MNRLLGRWTSTACFLWLGCAITVCGQFPVQVHESRLTYQADDQGNRIPDFSHCGYRAGDELIPYVPAKLVLQPQPGDDTARIQAAIDAISRMPLGENGFRGAVLLAAGEFEVNHSLLIRASGVVLRGSGALDGGTALTASGTDRGTVIQILPQQISGNRKPLQQPIAVTDEYVPTGSYQLTLPQGGDLTAGDRILIRRPSTAEWIASLGMDSIYSRWKAGSHDIAWRRQVKSVLGDTVTLDAPITTAIEERFGGAVVSGVSGDGATTEEVSNIGIEDLAILGCEPSRAQRNPEDEEHAWYGISITEGRDCWIQRVHFRHFAGGAVMLRESSRRITVSDCIASQPVSELGGYRRHTYFTRGQQSLFLRCWSEDGRHDFATGHCSAGPNAFVNCVAMRANDHSGPIESWSSGVLFDNVRIDGGGLHLQNAGNQPRGCGWTSANSVIWQCRASSIRCERPPGANNWALGVWSETRGDGNIAGTSEFVAPLSLYQQQLQDRLGTQRATEAGPFLLQVVAATRPSVSQAAEFVRQSSQPAKQLIDVIRANMRNIHRAPVSTDLVAPNPADSSKRPNAVPPLSLAIRNGWLTINGGVVTGDTYFPRWWRGSLRPSDSRELGPAITRFAPGFDGRGYTDRLPAVVDEMLREGQIAYDHHYGLWYDRRRDDHLMVRRADADVVAPFYEQPFARSGQGKAWDGLSQYDLTKYNRWYWQRLDDFARLCDQRGLLLFHHHYFQHNILEAGAHWADSPWRSANNINQTGFPEPPPYVSDKRIFQAHLFYDVRQPVRRALHRAYIRQCLEYARGHNVIHLISGEFTGPLEFVQFWLDTVAEWQRDTGADALVALSCTKDVQDAVLRDRQRASVVDIIDVRYWTYTRDGELYAPQSGQNLSPRQHRRLQQPKSNSSASIARSVRECRLRFANKAVTYFADQHCGGERDGWAILISGGSVANVPPLPTELAQAIASMQPTNDWIDSSQGACLTGGEHILIYCFGEGSSVKLQLPKGGKFGVSWLDPSTGREVVREVVTLTAKANLPTKSKLIWLQPAQ